MVENANIQSHLKSFIKITVLVRRLCTINQMCKNKKHDIFTEVVLIRGTECKEG